MHPVSHVAQNRFWLFFHWFHGQNPGRQELLLRLVLVQELCIGLDEAHLKILPHKPFPFPITPSPTPVKLLNYSIFEKERIILKTPFGAFWINYFHNRERAGNAALDMQADLLYGFI